MQGPVRTFADHGPNGRTNLTLEDALIDWVNIVTYRRFQDFYIFLPIWSISTWILGGSWIGGQHCPEVSEQAGNQVLGTDSTVSLDKELVVCKSSTSNESIEGSLSWVCPQELWPWKPNLWEIPILSLDRKGTPIYIYIYGYRSVEATCLIHSSNTSRFIKAFDWLHAQTKRSPNKANSKLIWWIALVVPSISTCSTEIRNKQTNRLRQPLLKANSIIYIYMWISQ